VKTTLAAPFILVAGCVVFSAAWSGGYGLSAIFAQPAGQPSPIANPEKSFEEVMSAWRAWEKRAQSIPRCKGKQFDNKRPNDRLEFEYSLDVPGYYFHRGAGGAGGQQFERVIMWNPRYKASISRADSGELWRVNSILARGEEATAGSAELAARFDNVHVTVRLEPRMERALKPSGHRIKKAERYHDRTTGYDVRRYVCEVIPDDVRRAFTEFELIVAEQLGLLPIRLVRRSVLPREGLVESVYHFEEWKQYDDIWYWTRCVLKSNNERAPVITTTWSIPEDGKSLDHSVCFLSHYGLPEPDIGSPSTWWNRALLAVGVVLVLAAVVYFIRRGRR